MSEITVSKPTVERSSLNIERLSTAAITAGSRTAASLAGKYVELYDYADRPLEVRWNGVPLPYRVFSKDQRVNHTAIIDNKRLGHALALVKAQQDLKYAPKVMTNSEKTGYQKRPSRIYASEALPDRHPVQASVVITGS